jgi:hypothetical protein
VFDNCATWQANCDVCNFRKTRRFERLPAVIALNWPEARFQVLIGIILNAQNCFVGVVDHGFALWRVATEHGGKIQNVTLGAPRHIILLEYNYGSTI